MAGFVVAPNTIKVLINWTWNGRPQLNVLHALYTPAGPLSPNIAESIFASVKSSAAWTAYETTLSPDLSFAGVSVLDERSANNPLINSTSDAVPGTGTGNAMPEQVASVITLRTAHAGRSFRGRVYLFGYTVAAADALGHITAGVQSSGVNFVTAFQTAIASQSGQLAIKSPALPERPAHGGGTLPEKPFAITPVTQIVSRDNIFDTNRRRQDLLRR